MPGNKQRTSFQDKHRSLLRNGQNIPQIAVAANDIGKGRYSERKGKATLKGYSGSTASVAGSAQNLTTIDTQEPLSAQGANKVTLTDTSISENRSQSLLHS